jgi:hypothetical protein
MKVVTFWDIAPCGLYVNRRFERKYQLQLQCRKLAEQDGAISQKIAAFIGPYKNTVLGIVHYLVYV